MLTGEADTGFLPDPDRIGRCGNILDVRDETHPALDFDKILARNEGNFLGEYIRSFDGAEEGSPEYIALCEGVRAILDTMH